MKYIAHRINKIEELKSLPLIYGAEVDLRDDINGNLYLAHDPFVKGDLFEEFLKHYHHGTLIVNTKSERVEIKALELLEKYKIQDFFFLDSSFPMIYTLSEMGEHRIAMRFSEFERMDTIRKCAGRALWVWVDFFQSFHITKEEADELHKMGYKLCMVSPELQGQQEKLDEYIKKAAECNMDAVCSKINCLERWRENYE